MDRIAIAKELLRLAKGLVGGRIKRWRGVEGTYAKEVGELPSHVRHHLPKEVDDSWELVIEFESEGYYDPGRLTGPPEDSYPPEGEEERTLVSAYVHSGVRPDTVVNLDKHVSKQIFDDLYEKIMEVELREIEPPERDDW